MRSHCVVIRRSLGQAIESCIERLESRTLLSAAAAAVNTKLAAEGTVEVDVRASDVASGTITSVPNEGAAGGSFTPWTTTAPTVATATDSNNVSYQALHFDGTTALKSTFNSPDDLDGNSPRSIEVWVLNPTIDGGEETMVSWARRGGPDGTNESFSYGSNYVVGQWGAEYDMTWSGSATGSATGTAPDPNLWHNFTFTYDGKGDANGGGTEDVYVDGQLIATGPSDLSGTVAALATAAGFTVNLGAQNDGGNNPAILGSLDIASVRISNGALTPEDVMQNFLAGVPGQSTPTSAPAAAPVVATPRVNGGVVRLNWSYVGDAGTGFGYNVFRSDSAHPTPTAIATHLDALSYVDNTVTNGTAYTYYVTASNSAGSSANSNSVTATPVSAPATPPNFTAGRAGSTSTVFLKWGASPDAPTGTTYDVKRGTVLNADGTIGGTIVDITPGGISGTSATDTNAAPNTTYYYSVTATSPGGTSAASTAAKVNAAPAAVNTTLAAEGTVEVDLRAIDATPGPVTSIINEGTAGGSFVPFTTNAPVVGGFTDANGVTYQAVNLNQTALKSTFNSPDDLNGANPRSIEVWVLNPTIDSPEETMVAWARRGGPDGTNESLSYGNVYAVGEWGGAYDMTWAGSAAPGSSGMAPPANLWHNITFTYDGNGNEDVYVDGQLDLAGPSDMSGTVQALATAAGFPVAIGAQNDANGNPASLGNLDIASVRISAGALSAADVLQNFKAGVPGQTTPTAAPSGAPTILTPVTTGGLVQLAWTYHGDAGTGFRYDLFRSDPSHPTPTLLAGDLQTATYTDTTVTNGVTYTYTVLAKNSAGSGPQSAPVTATPVAKAPASPTNFTGYRAGISGNVNLSWTGSQFATSYTVTRGTAQNADGSVGGTITTFTTTGTTFTDTTAPGTDLYYSVSAVRTGLASAPTTAVHITGVPTSNGLNDNVFHLGGGNSNAFNGVFGGNNAALGRVSNWAATHAADYSFVNTNDQFNYMGDSGAATPDFLGADAAGAALTDTANQNDTIYDAQGYFNAPSAGTYTFQVGDGTNNQADDIVGIYVNGDGTPGSGTLVATDGWQGATSPFAVDPSTPGKATFNITTPGKIPVEIIYGNGFGGAFLHGVAITDPSGTQVTYGVQPVAQQPQFNKADFNHSGKVDFADLLILAQNYGKAADNAHGDANGDGKVDFADLLILAQNYGKTGPQAAKTRGSLLSDVVGLVKTH